MIVTWKFEKIKFKKKQWQLLAKSTYSLEAVTAAIINKWCGRTEGSRLLLSSNKFSVKSYGNIFLVVSVCMI